MTYHNAWGEDRVYVQDESGQMRYLPIGWTSEAPVDAFKAVADGRCTFRPDDCLRLGDLVELLEHREPRV